MSGRSSEDRCSLRSLAANESLVATASTIRRWILLEHPGPWGRDGLLDARLPAGLGRDLRALEGRTRARVLLIRRPGRPNEPSEQVLCVGVDTREARLGVARLDRLDDAVGLDPRDPSTFPLEPDLDALFVVCTHGRRDPCCAEHGRPLAERLGSSHPHETWESTHVGGDRFAANLVAFPHGLYFGRVDPDEGPAIVEAYRAGRIGSLRRYRGRSSDPRHVQAAERVVRGELAADGIDEVRPVRQFRRGDAAEVTLATPRGEVRVELERILGTPLRLTCHAVDEEAPPIWRTVGIELADG